MGQQSVLQLGNLDARRDWGYAREYVEAMWHSLQVGQAGDYLLATGQAISVREFAVAAFAEAGLDVHFEGSGTDEVGYPAIRERRSSRWSRVFTGRSIRRCWWATPKRLARP